MNVVIVNDNDRLSHKIIRIIELDDNYDNIWCHLMNHPNWIIPLSYDDNYPIILDDN